ncbi:SDR family NAD(P)-dependent oxidoreductase [Clostridium luticellarii]|uniref:UDP-glucose 4-epimerase n=1 Tax=Clostridium luticellarii TaxID=1691940 RepID=A0A2T0B3E6_9CLOT|nr:SDR family NAD(P)-dependent oxidoreductase [Clostridium luticellarii]PRR78418.1 UDP-glucose 4-epimerase [Clostridium luticellarii]
MKTILVTGGAGFIGSHLCEALLNEGNKVIVIDNFNNYYNPMIKGSNIQEIKNTMKYNKILNGNFKLFEGDIRNKEDLTRVFREKIDIIVHLAAMAGVRPSIQNPELYYDVNIMGTLNLLEQCKKNKITKFVFASSSSIYGNNKKVPFSENDNVDFPISPYAATKKSCELLLHTYHHLYNISTVCLRFFTVYGPRQRPDLAIHKFTKLILERKKIPFYGDGTTERDYTYISDIINGILSAIEFVCSDNCYEIFNVGGDHTISLKEMVETIESTLNKKAELNIMPMQPGDVNRTCADITKSDKILGYRPNVNFEEGIKKFVDWYKIKRNDLND